MTKRPSSPIRIALCQTVLPQYRVAVYNLLGAQPGVELTVFADARMGSLESASGQESFLHKLAPVKHFHLLGQEFRTQAAHFQAIDPRRFDLAILPWDTRYANLLPAVLKARLRGGPPVVLWGHGYSRRPGALRNALRNFYGRRADAVLLYTRTVANSLTWQSGFDPKRVFVAQNALDQSPIRAAREHWLAHPEELCGFAAEHGLAPDRTLIFVSRMEAENGIEMLLHALVHLCAEEPETRLVMVGDGPKRTELETLAVALGIRERVIFTGKIYDDMALAPWMLSATLLCYPQSIGLSLLHAFGYGLPVVTGDDIQGHPPEIEALTPEVNGLLCRHGDARHMAGQCLRIMRDKGLRQRLSRAALRQVAEEYTLERMVQGFLDLLTMVDGQQRTVAPRPLSGA
ncbi:MAG: glycosyltransferase family 4 protein [Proteobacteria bacterium]|nr:glycosyltransferase family 4 protein [Pseudomonadota bacterium]